MPDYKLCLALAYLFRHPGDVAYFDEYRSHLPEQWCPMVTVIGSVQSYNNDSLGISESRRFIIETAAYDTTTAGPVHFSVTCFFENTKRWERVKTPLPGAVLSVTAKIAGRTTDTNHLAIRVLDLTYLPRPASAPATPSSTTTPPSKRSGRWEGRPAPSTPSKRPRTSDPATNVANSSSANKTLPGLNDSILDLTDADSTIEAPSVPVSPSIYADPGEPRLASILSPTSDSGTRPSRNRHPPKKYSKAK